MKNRGSVTIFCCLIITAIVILGITAIEVCGHHLAKAKGAVALRSAMSGVDAGYNSYIFENYHILLFDKNCDGRGEAYLEEQLIRDLQYNLGENFTVEDISVSDYQLILEDDLAAFKEQITDYCGYAMLEGGAQAILESTDGKDGTLEDKIFNDMDVAENEEPLTTEEAEDAAVTQEGEQEDIYELLSIGSDEEDDPRDYTENLSSEMILSMVVPEDMEVSNEIIPLTGVPSLENEIYSFLNYEIDNDFDDMTMLKKDVGEFDSWKDSLVNGGAGLVYAANVFNCATEEINEETVFSFELEYIIAGKASDMTNLKSVVNKIIGIRFPVNFGYLVSDALKMAEVKKLSWPIALATFVPEPVVRYLIAGCWAYVESIFDVRCLLDGQRMDFFKTKATWKTDLNDLENSHNLEGTESDTGLAYKDYLLILLALDMNGGYYRMLDIIELNTKQHYPDFDMNYAAVAFATDAHISYAGKDYYYREAMGY